VTRPDLRASAESLERPPADLHRQLTVASTIRTLSLEAAFRAVPRHLCLPGVPVHDAYADTPVYVKTQGQSRSAQIPARHLAIMLEQLGVRHRQAG
jgi:protein-L-isoaspartate(D-aspartate) O-methyltransferase